jgi:hypothetical protein
MLAIPWLAKLANRNGWADAADVSQRALMAIMAAYIVLTGNSVPKRITSLACRGADPARVQAFHRFAGWTWVLTGLVFGSAWVLLSRAQAGVVTLVVVPLGMSLVALAWFRLEEPRRPAA